MTENIIQQLTQRTEDGLWDSSLLDETQLWSTTEKTLTAREATDAQFLEWLLKEMGGIDICNRLRWRMVCVLLLDQLKGLKDGHFEEE